MPPLKSRKASRQEKILAAFEENPALRVNQLADELSVSTETVRRDLAELEGAGRISRTYGGAIKNSPRFEPALSDRLALKVSERRAIARVAVSLCAGDDALFLGGGATMVQFARALCELPSRLTVVTPVYPIAIELSANPAIEVIMLPGYFEAQEHMTVGPDTLRAMDRYNVRTSVIGASGVSSDGISEALLKVGEVYGAMVEKSEQTIVLADSDKFNRRALVQVSDWSKATTLVTDVQPEGELRSSLERSGAPTIVVPAGDRS